MLKHLIITTYIALTASSGLFLNAAAAIEPERQTTRPASSESQLQSPLQDQQAKRSLLDKGEIALERIEPDFVCSMFCHGPWLAYEITQDISCPIEVGTTNIDTKNVRVKVELSYWEEHTNTFYPATNIPPDTYDLPTVSRHGPSNISWEKTLPPSTVSETGCYMVEDVNYPLVNCKWKISATVFSIPDQTDAVVHPPIRGIPGRSHSSDAQPEGAHCEEVITWSVREEPPETD
jgi:hypothetical protein